LSATRLAAGRESPSVVHLQHTVYSMFMLQLLLLLLLLLLL
jgi:hypothetical protein